MSKKKRPIKSITRSVNRDKRKVNVINNFNESPFSTDSETEVILRIKVKQSQVDTIKSSLASISPDIKVNVSDISEQRKNPIMNGVVIQPRLTIYRIDDEKYLTAREVDVLNRLTLGRINKEIAEDLKLQESTIKNYIQSIFKKFGVNNRTEANNRFLIISGKLNPTTQ